MKTKLITRLVLPASFLLVFSCPSKSQVLEVSTAISPEEMVEILIGGGLEYSNVVFTGADSSRGSFTGGPGNLGLGNGIILTSGNIQLAPGPNLLTGAGAVNSTPGDSDLEMLSGAGYASYDACVLEFDFIPYYPFVWFQFVFASEEYTEYVGSAFNDVFGFFISGPGIEGPYSRNSKNIALLPGTEIPVSINNINPDMNSQYFVMNEEDFIQYDGFTTVLTAESEVVPMETYHIKLAISDIGDFIFDSGVLLQASSFCSGPVGINEENMHSGHSEKYRAYPVPAGDELTIVSQEGKEFTVILVGQDGRTWLTRTGDSKTVIDISAVPSGVYFLRIIDKSGVTTRKIIKN